jgi:hypothetical protein
MPCYSRIREPTIFWERGNIKLLADILVYFKLELYRWHSKMSSQYPKVQLNTNSYLSLLGVKIPIYDFKLYRLGSPLATSFGQALL